MVIWRGGDKLEGGTAVDRPAWRRRQGEAASEMQESFLNSKVQSKIGQCGSESGTSKAKGDR